MTILIKKELNTLIKAPWYTRVARYLFGVDKILLATEKEFNSSNYIPSYKTLSTQLEKFTAIHFRYLSKKLINYDEIVSTYQNLLKINDIIYTKKIEERQQELSFVKNDSKNSTADLLQILNNKKEFLTGITSSIRKPKLAPSSIGEMGHYYGYQQIHLNRIPGQPLTYENLLLEKQATQKRMDDQRCTLAVFNEDRHRITAVNLGGFYHTVEISQSERDQRHQRWKQASFIVDAGVGILNWVQEKIKKLSLQTFYVEPVLKQDPARQTHCYFKVTHPYVLYRRAKHAQQNNLRESNCLRT